MTIADQQALERMRQRAGWCDPRVLDALGAVVESETKLVLKEVSVKALLENLTLVPHLRLSNAPDSRPAHCPTLHEAIDRMILAEDVCPTKDFLGRTSSQECPGPIGLAQAAFTASQRRVGAQPHGP